MGCWWNVPAWTQPYKHTLMYVRQQLVPPSLSTASIPYLTHGVWRASGWPVNMCARVCVHVWPQWRLIRAGYGKRRLKPWIMEKLIWSMDQQETASMQHTRTHTLTRVHRHTHTHTTCLPNEGLVEIVLLLVITVTHRQPPFNDKD